jgi:hypothetical protein
MTKLPTCHTSTYFTDAEVDEMCDGLTQNAAKVRFLRQLGLRVDRKPNGRPLAWRPTEPGTSPAKDAPAAGPNVVGLQQWFKGKKHGAPAQGR